MLRKDTNDVLALAWGSRRFGREEAPVAFVLIVAISALCFACRPGYSVAPRVFFALAMAFAIAALEIPNAAAAAAVAIVLVVLGGITLIVDSKRIRIQP